MSSSRWPPYDSDPASACSMPDSPRKRISSAVRAVTRSLRCASRPAVEMRRVARLHGEAQILVDRHARKQVRDLERTAEPGRGDSIRRQPGDRLRRRARTEPRSGANMPVIRLKTVVLPAPLGPISACSVRSRTASDASVTALMPPNAFARSRASSTTPPACGACFRNSGSGTPCSIARASIAAASTTFGLNGSVSRRQTPTSPVGENTMNADEQQTEEQQPVRRPDRQILAEQDVEQRAQRRDRAGCACRR